jgi:hypothetical protein
LHDNFESCKFLLIPILFLQMNLSTCCVAFRWHHMVEISKLNKSNKIITNAAKT